MTAISATPTFPPIGSATFNVDAYAWAVHMAGTFTTEVNAAVSAMAALAAGGAVSLQYTFSTTTTDADPGAGTVRLDNATQNSATTIRADLAGSDGSDLTGVLALFDDSTSTNKGYLTIRHSTTPTKWLVFAVASVASPSGYKNVTATCVASSAASPFVNGDAVLLDFTPTGDKGDTGATGTGITPQAIGFTLSGGTTSKTLTVALDASVAGTNTGDQDLSGKQAVLVSGTSIKTINSESLLGSGDIAVGSSLVRSARTSNTILAAGDNGTLIDITSGTFTQTLTAAATLGSGWFCYIRNSGTGVVTLDPNASETIGGATTATLNAGDFWLIQCDGSNFNLQRIDGGNSIIYTSGSGNFTFPAGVYFVYAELWGGGGGVDSGGANSGAGSGGYCAGWLFGTPGSTLAYAVGASGSTAGGTGGNTTFSTFTANGGTGGTGYGGRGVGGTASGGQINLSGSDGYADNNAGGTNYGGAAPLGGGAARSQAGKAPGGGAGGANVLGGSGQINIRWV